VYQAIDAPRQAGRCTGTYRGLRLNDQYGGGYPYPLLSSRSIWKGERVDRTYPLPRSLPVRGALNIYGSLAFLDAASTVPARSPSTVLSIRTARSLWRCSRWRRLALSSRCSPRARPALFSRCSRLGRLAYSSLLPQRCARLARLAPSARCSPFCRLARPLTVLSLVAARSPNTVLSLPAARSGSTVLSATPARSLHAVLSRGTARSSSSVLSDATAC
jgi:hypothetical protein